MTVQLLLRRLNLSVRQDVEATSLIDAKIVQISGMAGWSLSITELLFAGFK